MKKSQTIALKFETKPPVIVGWGRQSSPVGPIMIGMTEEGALCRIHFMNGKTPAAVLKEWQREWPRTKFIQNKNAATKIAQSIFAKRSHRQERINLNLTGTVFQQRVWKALMTIPSGRVVSYADIAVKIKKPKAVRAVGNALGANPIPILVPCHRVIASNGTLGGYGGGLKIKKSLLKSENAEISTR